METEALARERVTFSADAERRARIAVAEYARTSGVYDPVDMLEFVRWCIAEATARCDAEHAAVHKRTLDDDALVIEALSVASATCGICRRRKGDDMTTKTTNDDMVRGSAPLPMTNQVVRQLAANKPIVPVPKVHERSMPPQPLGELPDVRPTRLWNSAVQSVWRALGTAVSSMFARSE
jgi:hypothetical protein